jgi:hypothetical protein
MYLMSLRMAILNLSSTEAGYNGKPVFSRKLTVRGIQTSGICTKQTLLETERRGPLTFRYRQVSFYYVRTSVLC